MGSRLHEDIDVVILNNDIELINVFFIYFFFFFIIYI